VTVGSVHAQSNPIIFVTQIPIPADFATINSTFANHLPDVKVRGVGGDLWIRYPDGTLKNLTEAAGYGQGGMQGANAIAVRDPSVHWDGKKVVFSMIVGAPTKRYEVLTRYWQLYEMTGLGKDETPVVTKLQQPSDYNNVMPAYGSDDAIIFVSDRPRDGERHLYPQRDEYESTPTNTGLWRLDPGTGAVKILDHSPSGDFHPIVDSFGRVLFTRWDHLQTDQQAGKNNDGSDKGYGAFNYADESENAARSTSQAEHFPELQDPEDQVAKDPSVNSHRMNLFLPWMINQDGTGAETLNHIGRHELSSYLERSFKNDPNVVEWYGQYARFNKNAINNFFHLKEDPTRPGIYYGVDAPEFGTHTGGQIISINGSPSTPADKMSITYVTHRATASASDNPDASHSGLYRDPLPLTSGALVAVHTAATRADANTGTSAAPKSRYDFRIKRLVKHSNGYYVPDQQLTPGITKSVSFWDPDNLVTYSDVTLWELQPVELVFRVRPPAVTQQLEQAELGILSELGVSVAALQEYLRSNDLALIVSRNVTTRDSGDLQQPSNLRIAGTKTETVSASGKVYDVSHLQLFQGDLVRGYRGVDNPSAGRRVLARPMHGVSLHPQLANAPEGSVKLGTDGSMAAFVPARRAMTWQLTAPDGSPVVRERVWLTFAPGEIRLCKSCHGINHTSQVGLGSPENAPEALRSLLIAADLTKPGRLPESPATPTPDVITTPSPRTNGFTLGVSPKDRVRSGKKVTLEIRGGAGQRIALHLSVGTRACTVPAKIKLGAQGVRRVPITLPEVGKNTSLSFELRTADGSVVATRSLTVLRATRARRGGDVGAAVCRAFSSSFR
jgi:hypothetical protein